MAKALVDLVLVFVLSVYMLVYGQSIGKLVRHAMPPGDGPRADDFPTLAQHAVSRYVGGQLLFSVVMGTSTGLALYLFGVLGIFPDGRSYALAFAVFYGVMELVPYIGPILGAIPPCPAGAVHRSDQRAVGGDCCSSACSNWRATSWRPQIFSHTLRINPLLVIFALLLGLQLYGIIGALVALADPLGVAGDRHLPASPSEARAVGALSRRAAVSEPRSRAEPVLRVEASASATARARRCTTSASPPTPASWWL